MKIGAVISVRVNDANNMAVSLPSSIWTVDNLER